jgi:hypothetical protein
MEAGVASIDISRQIHQPVAPFADDPQVELLLGSTREMPYPSGG